MELLSIDTVVEFGDPNQKKINGWITAINIRKKTISYEISYWLLDDLKCVWLPESLFIVKDDSKKTKIGFNPIK